MTDPSPDRKAHIRRFIGTNENGDQLTDIWVDMLRLDKWKTAYNGGLGVNFDGAVNQKIIHTLDWQDDSGSTGNPDATTHILRVFSPDETDPQNPTEWIEIPINDVIQVRATKLSGTGIGADQKKKVTIHTPDDQTDMTDREFTVVKVTHKDTNIDDNPDFDNGGVIDFDLYQKLDGTEDKDNYVNACVTTSIKTKATHESGTGIGADQLKTKRFNNQYIIEQFSPPDSGDSSDSAPPFNPPWIFDPYQYVWNVNFGALAVEFLNGAS